MARRDFKLDISLLDQNSPHGIELRVVDKSILNEEDLDFILRYLPPVSEARVDAERYKPYLGVDMFYDVTASLKGVVFVYDSRALAIRVPDDVEKTSAKAYERRQAMARKTSAKPYDKLKGRPQRAHVKTRLTALQCLQKLFQSDLAGFGMAQISLTLWHYLRERVAGINLSTATSEATPPPRRTFFEPRREKDLQSDTVKSRGQQGGRNGRGDNKGGQRGGRYGRGEAKAGQNDSGRTPSKQAVESGSAVKPPAILPEDEPLNWDREIISPGETVKKIYPDVSVIDIDTAFIGNEAALDMEARVGEAVTRAWVSYIVAHELNTAVQNAPVVQPSNLRDKELTFFAESMVIKWKVLGETSPLRQLQLEHFDDEGGNLKSTKYETKLRGGDHQYLTWYDGDEERRLYLQRLPGKPKEVGITETEGERLEPPSRQESSPQDNGPRGGGRRGSRQRRQGQVREYSEESSDLHGPDSTNNETEAKKPAPRLPKDIDIVWFPTYDQKSLGEKRKKEKSTAVRGKHDWMDDDWGDDTDEEEVARIQALRLADGESDQDDETEGEDVGQIDPTLGISLPKEIRLNQSQRGVVGRMVAPNPRGRTRATLVHGPPGTGKTSTIAAAVWIFAEIDQPVWIIAQSNVGIKNVAEKLVKVGFMDFTLLVSQDYHSYWMDRYNLVRGAFYDRTARGSQVAETTFRLKAVLCTLGTLSSGYLDKYGVFNKIPLQHLIVDEASQIDMTSEFMHIFYRHRSTLKSVCWFGDPNQLPPFGWSEGTEIQDIFKVEHLLANSRLLDTSYRLPIPIAKYISRAVYRSQLKPHMGHSVKQPSKAIVFVDVADGQEEGGQGSGIGGTGASWQNTAEAEVTTVLVQTYYERSFEQDSGEEKKLEYVVITPYDGQRILVGRMFEEAGIKQQVYNVDSFQGNEADYIITSIAKTGGPGFLNSINRLNVLLTRCKRGLIVVTQKEFVQRAGGLLLGLLYSLEPYDPWVSAEDVVEGYVDLPGSPAPNTRPPPNEREPAPASREDLPGRPGARVPPPSIAQIVQPETAEGSSDPTGDPGRYTYGMNRPKATSLGVM
ncbi:ATP-dependent DNA helicase [Ceratobasidium sp. AG-Ba]|nr:ATP-dependent DNA helicase [Ceratobasidium sp. AG-Ba]